jgi:hypothetical protein
MYVTELLRCTPSALKFLRYNAFIVLYPLGLVGEVCGLLLALDAYSVGLCPPSFPKCADNSVGLYTAYVYLIVAVPGKQQYSARIPSCAVLRAPLTPCCRLPQALHAHVLAARQAFGRQQRRPQEDKVDASTAFRLLGAPVAAAVNRAESRCRWMRAAAAAAAAAAGNTRTRTSSKGGGVHILIQNFGIIILDP